MNIYLAEDEDDGQKLWWSGLCGSTPIIILYDENELCSGFIKENFAKKCANRINSILIASEFNVNVPISQRTE